MQKKQVICRTTFGDRFSTLIARADMPRNHVGSGIIKPGRHKAAGRNDAPHFAKTEARGYSHHL